MDFIFYVADHNLFINYLMLKAKAYDLTKYREPGRIAQL